MRVKSTTTILRLLVIVINYAKAQNTLPTEYLKAYNSKG